MGIAPARSFNAAKRTYKRGYWRYDRRICSVGWQRKVMTWLLLMVQISASHGFEVAVLSEHETMAECHVAGTRIHWEERMPVNKEMLCFATDVEVRE